MSEDDALIYERPKEGLAQQVLKGGGLLVEDIESTLWLDRAGATMRIPA